MTSREGCDQNIENCDIPLKWPEHGSGDMYTFAAVSFLNAVLPTLYYSISSDYGGDRDRKRIEAREGKVIV